ncbi:BLUF domain-containing protein [Wocania ichthyoenteri]|uniref:BLUF domain-containing protein n=1 Tax=Wocania ichthyoenteri TaxID=1230531 RepID=UPI0009DCC9A9|nr:BLUF domain-containing protein [Wocania ichthyoenteri]
MYYSVIYRSSAEPNFSQKEINYMLLKAKQHNKMQGITGCIIYSNNQFIQIIEGNKDVILDLYTKIKADDRHFDVTTLIEEPSKEMLWDDWSMAFYDFSGTAEQNNYSRMLLETYFENANSKNKSSEVFLTLKKNVIKLISTI